MAERLFTTFQVANLLGTTPGAVIDWIKRKWLGSTELPGGMIRISESALVKFLAQRGVNLGELLKKVASPDEQEQIQAQAKKQHTPKPAAQTVPPTPQPSEPEPDYVDVDPVETPEIPETTAEKSQPQAEFNNADAVAQQIVDAVIENALAREADQIHFTLADDKLTLKFRTGRDIKERPNFSKNLPDYLVKQIPLYLIKRATDKPANLSMPVDGKFVFTPQTPKDSSKIKLKLSAMPRTDGYSIILTIDKPANLESLAMEAGDILWLKDKLYQPSGLILVCSQLAGPRQIILDAMYRQVAMKNKVCVSVGRYGCDFRPEPSDQMDWKKITTNIESTRPDILMISELREPTATYSAFETAHNHSLVLAGLKSPSPAAAITELFESGIEPWPLAKTLQAIISINKETPTLTRITPQLADKIKYKPSIELLKKYLNDTQSVN